MSEAEVLGQMIKKAVKEVLDEDILMKMKINIHNDWINMKQQWILLINK